MSETVMHLVGNVGNDVEHRRIGSGTDFASFRLAATPRYYDRQRGAYVDGTTNWMTVECWRELAAHVSESVHRGDPVIVIGRLKTREWEHDGKRNSRFIVEATSVGHDLGRGVSRFSRASRAALRGGQGGDSSPAAERAARPAEAGRPRAAWPDPGAKFADAS